MFVTVINDCKSPNEVGRQETRLISLLGSPISFMGVSSDFSTNATLEAAGNLIDVLDAAEGAKGAVLVNVAPRGESKKDGHNGTAFCYFYYKDTLVISTVRGHSLSLVKKLGLVNELHVVEVEEVVKYARDQGLINDRLSKYIPRTQFRSFDFVPRLAHWIMSNVAIPHTTQSFKIIEDIPNCIWYIDAFGNCKTTSLANELAQTSLGEIVNTTVGELPYYPRLKDLPKGETAVYAGSSGIEEHRFVEIATQMTPGSAAKKLGLKMGDAFEIK